ncbi:MAG: DUF4982 domain-containing protein [Clostridia bacterium]|nr:DUF4982 domain-containing protein [Clostridia bacterium]
MRHVLNLDKEWRFLPGDGVMEAQKTHSDSYNSCKAGQERGIPSVNYDDSEWRIINVPHDYLTETEFKPENLISHGYKTRHNAWYRKNFTLPEEYAGKHLLLSFEGMAVTARVYFNGSLAGRSHSAYAPLDIDITDRAHFGSNTNTLAVFIDGMTTEGWWYEGAGIYRHVKLYVKDTVHIAHDSQFIKPTLIPGTENDRTVRCEITAENSGYTAETVCAHTDIYDGDKIIASCDTDAAVCDADLRVMLATDVRVEDPVRWDVDAPKLYHARTTLFVDGKEADTVETDFGFRTFSVDADKGFFLNGMPIKLKGTCNHQDHAGVGVAVPDSIQYYRIKRLKEMGTNAYRCAHNMPAKEILDACDRLGILVMDENRRFDNRPEVISHVEAMVKRDRNHPSVVFYSLFNEEPLQGTAEGGRIFRRMKQAVLRLDNSRLVTGAMNGGYNDAESAAAFMDITGINYAVPEGVLEYRALYPNTPVFGSENNSAVSTRGCFKTDADAHVLNCYDDETVPWGQLIKDTWKFTREHDWFGGIFIWTGFDYRGEPTPYTWPSIGSSFGIMDTCGFPKESFYFNRSCFVDEPVLRLMPHWNQKPGEEVRVMAASNCDEIELFLNGRSLGKKPSDCCAPAEWQVIFEPGVLSAVGYRNGEIAAKTENRTAGKPAKIVIEADRTVISNDGADTVPVNLSVIDENGVTCETADNLLHIEVLGQATLLGVGNGDPNGLESDHEPRRSLFAGHAQALIQSRVGAENIAVRVTGDGLEAAELVFTVQNVPAPDYVYENAVRTVSGFTVTQKTYDEEPDVLMEIADNDMNSLEPISFDRWSLRPGFKSGFRFFRAFFTTNVSDIPNAPDTCEVSFGEVSAKHVKVYVNGILLHDADHGTAPLSVSFPCAKGKQKNELRVLLEAENGQPAGIRYTVTYGMK